MYDDAWAKARFLAAGCTPDDADDLVHAGIDPDVVGTHAPDAAAFARSATFHGIEANDYLEMADGNPDEAWRLWAKFSPEEGGGSDYEEDEEDEEDEEEYEEEVNAYIEKVGLGEFSIDLIDEAGLPGYATHVETLRFSIPATVPAGSKAERDARLIKAATEELADHGYIPDSDFEGGGDRFSVMVCTEPRAAEWLEAQRPPQEKLDRLLAKLEGLHLSDLPVAGVQPDHDNALIDIVPGLAPDQPDNTHQGADQASIVDWDDAGAFLRAVVDEGPATVYIQRYQGGYAERMQGWGDLKHPSIRNLKRTRTEAAQMDQELGGFIAAFRSGDAVHRYRVRASWADDLEKRLDALENRVIAVREEHVRFPRLKDWGKQLYEALINDDQFIRAQTSRVQDDRGGDLARSMFGPDCPVESLYIKRALTKARAKRSNIIAERQQAQLSAAIPIWAAQLAALPDFQRATTAQRAMLASNLIYAHNPSAETPELVRLLRHAAADLLG
jgi:hypothetical protein